MAEVRFYFNVADRWLYAGRLLRKMLQHNMAPVVVLNANEFDAIETLLWSANSNDFVTYSKQDADPTMAALSDVHLIELSEFAQVKRQNILNLTDEYLALTAEMQLFEIVSQQSEAKDKARQRVKQYKSQGIAVKYFAIDN